MNQTETCQSGILASVPTHGRYLWFQLKEDHSVENAKSLLNEFLSKIDGKETIVGLGDASLKILNKNIEGSVDYPSFNENGVTWPSTPAALWIWLRGSDQGHLLHKSREIVSFLSANFILSHSVDGFKYDGDEDNDGKDLTGYEDGTENPTGEDAVNAAFDDSGCSFVAVQQWQHNLDHFESLPQQEKDHIIGRRQSDNEELDDAPESAHVKRTAQESFSPEAFMLRRSMPYVEGQTAGLVFVCFASSTQPFLQQMDRMVGKEDGITDGLFRFSVPKTGAFFWLPPMKDGKIAL